jgi:hypothetical protein
MEEMVAVKPEDRIGECGAVPKAVKRRLVMSHPKYTSEEIARRGQALYEAQIQDKLDATCKGQFLVLDIETDEYELDTNELPALQRAKAKRPDAALYILRVGYSTTYRL